MSPFMYMVGDMGGSRLLQICKERSSTLIPNRKLEVGEEIHGYRIEILKNTSRELDVPLGFRARQSALEKM